MALVDQINVVECGAQDLLGTGTEACAFDWDRLKAIEISDASFTYEDELDLDQVHKDQQNENIFIINDADTFALVPVEPTISTSDGSGLESVDGELPYKYEATWKNKGVNFWKALRRFNSSGAKNIAFWDVSGNKIMTQTKNGLVKGFRTNLIFTGQYNNKAGNTAAMFKMSIQLSDDIKQMERQTWITSEQSGIGIDELDGYNDVFLTPQPLATSATSLVVKAILVDKSHFAGGMITTDFVIKKNGIVVVHTAVVADEVNKTYTFTIPAASAGTYTVDTLNTYGKKVVLVASAGLLYKGITGTVIVS